MAIKSAKQSGIGGIDTSLAKSQGELAIGGALYVGGVLFFKSDANKVIYQNVISNAGTGAVKQSLTKLKNAVSKEQFPILKVAINLI
jgi:hypothetical protein